LPRDFRAVQGDLGADNDFVNESDFLGDRNSLGALILLSRGRNRSLQKQLYSAKLGVYSTESILAQTLTDTFYKNNPQVAAKLVELNLPFTSILSFNQTSISARTEAYDKVSELIWAADGLLKIAP
jgi:hypothetical protein